MARYKIGMAQTVIEETTVYVEANNREEAEQKALALNEQGGVDWDFLEVQSEPVIVTVDIES